MRSVFTRLLPLIIAALFLLVACAQPAADPTPVLRDAAGNPLPPVPTLDANEVARGKEIYDLYCAACHGPNLEGEAEWQLPAPDGSFRAPPHDATGHTWHHSDRQLIEMVKRGGQRLPEAIGVSHMPAYEGILSEEEIRATLAYFKSSWPDEIRAVQWEITLQDEP